MKKTTSLGLFSIEDGGGLKLIGIVDDPQSFHDQMKKAPAGKYVTLQVETIEAVKEARQVVQDDEKLFTDRSTKAGK